MTAADEITELVALTLEEAELRDAAFVAMAAGPDARSLEFLHRWAERVDRALLILARHVAALEEPRKNLQPGDGGV